MYQSVGSENIEKIAQCLDKPLFRRYIDKAKSIILKIHREIKGKPVVLDLEYKGMSEEDKKEDEVEDLFEILKEVKVYSKHESSPIQISHSKLSLMLKVSLQELLLPLIKN